MAEANSTTAFTLLTALAESEDPLVRRYALRLISGGGLGENATIKDALRLREEREVERVQLTAARAAAHAKASANQEEERQRERDKQYERERQEVEQKTEANTARALSQLRKVTHKKARKK